MHCPTIEPMLARSAPASHTYPTDPTYAASNSYVQTQVPPARAQTGSSQSPTLPPFAPPAASTAHVEAYTVAHVQSYPAWTSAVLQGENVLDMKEQQQAQQQPQPQHKQQHSNRQPKAPIPPPPAARRNKRPRPPSPRGHQQKQEPASIFVGGNDDSKVEVGEICHSCQSTNSTSSEYAAPEPNIPPRPSTQLASHATYAARHTVHMETFNTQGTIPFSSASWHPTEHRGGSASDDGYNLVHTDMLNYSDGQRDEWNEGNNSTSSSIQRRNGHSFNGMRTKNSNGLKSANVMKGDVVSRLQQWCQERGLGNLYNAFREEIVHIPGRRAGGRKKPKLPPFRCVMQSDSVGMRVAGYGFRKSEARADACNEVLKKMNTGEYRDPGHYRRWDTAKERSWWGDQILDWKTPDVSRLHDLKVMFTSNEKLAEFLPVFLPGEQSNGEKADGTAVEAYIYDKWLDLDKDTRGVLEHLKKYGLLKIDDTNVKIDKAGNPFARQEPRLLPPEPSANELPEPPQLEEELDPGRYTHENDEVQLRNEQQWDTES